MGLDQMGYPSLGMGTPGFGAQRGSEPGFRAPLVVLPAEPPGPGSAQGAGKPDSVDLVPAGGRLQWQLSRVEPRGLRLADP